MTATHVIFAFAAESPEGLDVHYRPGDEPAGTRVSYEVYPVEGLDHWRCFPAPSKGLSVQGRPFVADCPSVEAARAALRLLSGGAS